MGFLGPGEGRRGLQGEVSPPSPSQTIAARPGQWGRRHVAADARAPARREHRMTIEEGKMSISSLFLGIIYLFFKY